MKPCHHIYLIRSSILIHRLPILIGLVFVIISTLTYSSPIFAATQAHAGRRTPVTIQAQSAKKIHGAHTDTILTFDDEFTETSLNTSIWNIEDYGTDLYHNCCLKFGPQYYNTQDVSLNQGDLRLTSEKRTVGTYNYTSGAVTTENKFSFLYGLVTIRARLPQGGKGIWPAFWLLTNDNKSNETDIMEMANDPTLAYQTFHANVPIPNSYISQCITHEPDLSADFHTYTLNWSPGSLTWFIDGTQVCQVTQDVPQTPMYLLLNTAVGGSWPGSPDANTVFPQYMDIDYVQVWQTDPNTSCTGLQVTSPLQLSTTTIARGRTITGTVTYTNNCTTSFALSNLIVGSRKSDGSNADFGNKTGPLTLLPGQSVTLNASRVIAAGDPLGQWDAFSSFELADGTWHNDGTNLQYFTVTG